MSRRVSIVMYHFVRDLINSRYPLIKGLDVRQFAGQIEYIGRHYNVVGMEDVIDAVDSGTDLPARALLLTFDDGYADHYQNVFPLLDRLGMPAAFFPPARAILEGKVLDVNKIHFLLAAVEDTPRLVRAMEELIEESRVATDIPELSWFRDTYARPNRWDTAEVIYVKRVLQRGLPENLRVEITDRLFQEFVTPYEAAFAGELYMSLDQIRLMSRRGMHVGSHSYDHYWLDALDEAAQEDQVLRSLDFLAEVGCDLDRWTMCYPYGGFNESLIRVLKRNGCRLGLSTDVAIADLDRADPFTLARLDTNDLPKVGNAPVNDWTQEA